MENLKRQSQSSCLGKYVSNFEDVPLAERRGLGLTDAGNMTIAVKESVQKVSEAIAERYCADVWYQDVYEQSITIRKESIVVFRFKSHDWTLVQEAGFQPIQFFPRLTYSYSEHLAKDLGTEAVFLKSADGLYQYYYYIGDKNLEGFYFDGYFDDDGDDSDRQNVLDRFSTLEYLKKFDGQFGFYSSFYKGDFKSLLLDSGLYMVVSNLLRHNSVYIPTVLWKRKKIGEDVRVSAYGLSNDDIERMDYISIPSTAF